jgi:hypothetical protein
MSIQRPIILSSLMFITFFLSMYTLVGREKFNEHFDQISILNGPGPSWFIKKPYKPDDWIVRYNPDKIQPTCVTYDVPRKYGSVQNLNYLSSAYRYWRF